MRRCEWILLLLFKNFSLRFRFQQFSFSRLLYVFILSSIYMPFCRSILCLCAHRSLLKRFTVDRVKEKFSFLFYLLIDAIETKMSFDYRKLIENDSSKSHMTTKWSKNQKLFPMAWKKLSAFWVECRLHSFHFIFLFFFASFCRSCIKSNRKV